MIIHLFLSKGIKIIGDGSMNKKYSLSSDYIRYLDSMIKENDKRQLNNKEVVDTLNNQNKTIEKLEETIDEQTEYIMRQSYEIGRLRRKLMKTKGGILEDVV